MTAVFWSPKMLKQTSTLDIVFMRSYEGKRIYHVFSSCFSNSIVKVPATIFGARSRHQALYIHYLIHCHHNRRKFILLALLFRESNRFERSNNLPKISRDRVETWAQVSLGLTLKFQSLSKHVLSFDIHSKKCWSLILKCNFEKLFHNQVIFYPVFMLSFKL